jgi:hypothetical protein
MIRLNHLAAGALLAAGAVLTVPAVQADGLIRELVRELPGHYGHHPDRRPHYDNRRHQPYGYYYRSPWAYWGRDYGRHDWRYDRGDHYRDHDRRRHDDRDKHRKKERHDKGRRHDGARWSGRD